MRTYSATALRADARRSFRDASVLLLLCLVFIALTYRAVFLAAPSTLVNMLLCMVLVSLSGGAVSAVDGYKTLEHARKADEVLDYPIVAGEFQPCPRCQRVLHVTKVCGCRA